MNYKRFTLLKLLLLIIALGLATFLAFGERANELSPDHKIVFVLDINRTMNTKDMLSGDIQLSRIDAAKQIISQIILSEPGFSYGLLLFNAGTDYIVPPTFDTGTFFLYLIGLTTNLLPQGIKDFSVLSGVLAVDDYASYIIISDFDTSLHSKIHFPRGTSLIGLGSQQGDTVRTANGIRYYESGDAVFSMRDDSIAKSFGLPYTAITQINDFSPDTILFHGISLPLSQRIFLYTLLGILVILVVML